MQSAGYRRLFISAAAVIFGVMGQAVARGWLARDLTGSNAGLGGVMLAFGIAMLIATPWGGVAADRFPKRTVLVVAVTILIVSSLFVGLAVVTDVIEYWMLLLASALQAAAFALYLPARIALIAEVVDHDQIGEAVVLSQTAQEAMRVIAPALAGVLIGLSWFGVGGVFLLSAGTSTLAAVVLFGLPAGEPRTLPTRSPIAEMVDAFQYVRSRRGLGLVALTTIGVVVIGFPYLTFLPTLADERYGVGAGGYGVMAGIAGLGAVTAGLIVPRTNWIVQRPWRTIAVAGIGLGISLIALGGSGVVLVGARRPGRRRRVRSGVPDDDAVTDAVALRRRLPRADAEHGRARLQRLRPRRAPARSARRRHHPGGDARRDGRVRDRGDGCVRHAPQPSPP